MHYTYNVCVWPKKRNESTSYWFQAGKLTTNVDFSKPASSNKGFRTKNKLETFCRWLNNEYPDTVLHVLEIRPSGRWSYEIPMGENWKEYITQ